MRRRLILAGLVIAASSAAAWSLTPAPGHLPLHIGCKNHAHGPVRTAGEGRRLIDARALNRQVRREQQ